MNKQTASSTTDIPAAEADEAAALRQRMDDFDRAKFACEVAGFTVRPDDEAHARSLIRRGLVGDELFAAMMRYFGDNPLGRS